MRTTRKPTALAAVATAAALLMAGCGTQTGGSGDDAPVTIEGAKQQKGGTVLDRPFEKPDVTLTNTEGEKYNLVEETKGHPTLLYFGYTHCPDVCPLTMSNIAIAESKLTKKQQEKLKVVFITSDPKRDTPERLDKWLRMQDPSFIGLTGEFETIQEAARDVGVALQPPKKKPNGDIVSTHGAQVLAFSPKDNKAHVVYTEGNVTVDVLTRELPEIIKGETP